MSRWSHSIVHIVRNRLIEWRRQKFWLKSINLCVIFFFRCCMSDLTWLYKRGDSSITCVHPSLNDIVWSSTQRLVRKSANQHICTHYKYGTWCVLSVWDNDVIQLLLFPVIQWYNTSLSLFETIKYNDETQMSSVPVNISCELSNVPVYV